MDRNIFLDDPNVGNLEKEYLTKAIDLGFVSTIGPFVPEFESKFAGYLGIDKAVSTQSGTAALHTVLYESGIGVGDEVIVPALTFVATISPVLYVGAKPVIVDVCRKTWNIDPDRIKKAITPKTKAIIPVHLYGNPCNMDEILEIAEQARLPVIEDATESLGAMYKGRYTGTMGDFGCFSFNGNKTITTGGGGMVIGRNLESLEHIKFLVNQARDTSKECYYPEVGFNYRMTNIEAALGLAQLKKVDDFLARKKALNNRYREELKDAEFVHFQEEYDDVSFLSWLTGIMLDEKLDIPLLQSKLKERGIPTRRVFTPVVEFPPYKKYMHTDYKNSYFIYNRGLCLPSSTLNSEDDVCYVCRTLRDVACRLLHE